MRLFWDRGFEGTSLENLIAVMEISSSSFYSAFGSKHRLFQEALEHYFLGPGSYLQQPTRPGLDAKTAIAAWFEQAVQACTSDDFPPGCMVSVANFQVGPDLLELRDEMRSHRNGLVSSFAARLSVARTEGEIPIDTDIEALAAYFAACFRGLCALARDGAPRERLMGVAQMAMLAWPSVVVETRNSGRR